MVIHCIHEVWLFIMCTILEDFWRWSGITPDMYEDQGFTILAPKCEFDYPGFDNLLNYAKKIFVDASSSRESLYDALTIMALDNENEEILDFVECTCTDTIVNLLVDIGVGHLQHEARWQIAELLYRRKPYGYMQKLQILSQDSHPYVRKRAANIIGYLQ